MSDARQCPNCKSELAPEATFCSRCGQRFEAPAAAAPPPPVIPAVPPAPVAPPVVTPAPPPPAPAPPPPSVPVVAPSPVRKSSPWPAILIGCGVLFVLVLIVGGVVGTHLVKKAKAELAKLETETSTTQSKTDTTAKTDDGNEGKSEGKTDDETPSPSDQKPVIEVSPPGSKLPPIAYRCDQVPPLDVKEGEEFGAVSNGDQAAGLVLAQADVQDWVKQIEQARAEGKKRTAMLTVETIPGSGNYLVHLFENVEDDDPGHTATYGWFKVDKDSGAVSNQTNE